MKFDLCIGDGEVFWEFIEGADRDTAWNNLIQSPGWEPEWAEKRGDGTGARSHIILHVDKMPLAYRWKCFFDKPDWLPTSENINALPDPIRRFIHDLETRCDKAGEVRELIIARDTIKQLEAKLLRRDTP